MQQDKLFREYDYFSDIESKCREQLKQSGWKNSGPVWLTLTACGMRKREIDKQLVRLAYVANSWSWNQFTL